MLGNLAAYPPALVLYMRQRVVVDQATGCWRWLGNVKPLDKRGRGGYAGVYIRLSGVYGRLAARLLYEMIHAPVSDGLELDHTCQDRPCVSPLHLEEVTHSENIRRGLFAKYERRHQEAMAGA